MLEVSDSMSEAWKNVRRKGKTKQKVQLGAMQMRCDAMRLQSTRT